MDKLIKKERRLCQNLNSVRFQSAVLKLEGRAACYINKMGIESNNFLFFFPFVF